MSVGLCVGLCCQTWRMTIKMAPGVCVCVYRTDGNEFSGSVFQKVNEKVEVGAQLSWSGSNSMRFGLAAKFCAHPDTTFRVRDVAVVNRISVAGRRCHVLSLLTYHTCSAVCIHTISSYTQCWVVTRYKINCNALLFGVTNGVTRYYLPEVTLQVTS